MRIAGATALVTGATGGLGSEFVAQLLDRGASRVYAVAPDATAGTPAPGVVVVDLDVCDPGAVSEVAASAPAVDLVVNAAGLSAYVSLVRGDLAAIRAELDVNVLGTLHVVRAFAPVLRSHGGGAVLNVLSALSFVTVDGAASYAMSKAAAWSLTNGLRLELVRQRTQVTALVVGAVDTAMTSGIGVPKSSAHDVVRRALDGLEAGEIEVLADRSAVMARQLASGDPAEVYPHTVPAQWRRRPVQP